MAKLVLFVLAAVCLQGLVASAGQHEQTEELKEHDLEALLEFSEMLTPDHDEDLKHDRNPITCILSAVKVIKDLHGVKKIVNEFGAIKKEEKSAEAECAAKPQADQVSCEKAAKETAKQEKIKVLMTLPSLGVSTATAIAGLVSCVSAL